MRTYLECIPCFMQQALRAARMVTDDEKVIKQILDKTGDMVKSISMHTTPPETGMTVYQIVKDITGVEDPYKEIKQQHIAETKAIYPELEKLVAKSKDKLLVEYLILYPREL